MVIQPNEWGQRRRRPAWPNKRGVGVFGAMLAFGAFGTASIAEAQSESRTIRQDSNGDRLFYSAHAATYVPFFKRALLPGPAGATVNSELAVPIHEYLFLRLGDIDSPAGEDMVDAELSLWAAGNVVDLDNRRRFEGDVSVANITHRFGPASVRLGRQIYTAGAARFAQFDGVGLELHTVGGFGASAYGGLTVLPQWSGRPSYQQLGSSFDTLVEDPGAFPEPTRTGNWLGGGRVAYSRRKLGTIGLSFHEERENSELGRRDVGADLLVDAFDAATLTGRALMDADSASLSDATVAFDVYPTEDWDVALEYRRVTPTLLLSRQSVLSVFSVDMFDELGLGIGVHPSARWSVGVDGAVDRLESGEAGYRAGVDASLSPDDAGRWVLLVNYGRVEEELNGYHSVRLGVKWRIADPFSLVGEHYTYLYDEPVVRLGSSNVEAASLQWQPATQWDVLLGGSAIRSPYAKLDTQVLLRVIYAAAGEAGGRP